MHILVVTATPMEVTALAAGLRHVSDEGPRLTRYERAGHDVDLLVTGVGMVSTAAWCARILERGRYEVGLNVGVCGSFDRALQPGSVVHDVSDRVPAVAGARA